jgi:catalase-peroxidase
MKETIMDNPADSTGKCPVAHHKAPAARSNRDWWPNQLNVQILHHNSGRADPLGQAVDYAEEFKKLDLEALK